LPLAWPSHARPCHNCTVPLSRRGGDRRAGAPPPPKSALLSPPPLRLRCRRARRPATSVTCGSMHRCGYTVPPVGSTKPHKAVCLWRRLPTLPLPLRLAQNELPPSAPPPSSFATAFVVLIVVCEEGEGGRRDRSCARCQQPSVCQHQATTQGTPLQPALRVCRLNLRLRVCCRRGLRCWRQCRMSCKVQAAPPPR